MWLGGSKPVRSNVTIPTTSFSRVFFFTNDFMCRVHYDVINHPFPINSQYLKTWGVDSLDIVSPNSIFERPSLNRSTSLGTHPFLLALRRWGRFARRNVCDSATEIPYWWRKICPESGQKRWLVDGVVTLFWLLFTNDRQKATKVKWKREESLAKQSIFVEYTLL